MIKSDKIADRVKEIINDGIDYLDSGMDLRLTLTILKEAVPIDAVYWLYIMAQLKAHNRKLKEN